MRFLSSTRSFVFFGEDVFSLIVLKSLVDSRLGLLPLAVVVLAPISVSGVRLTVFCKDRGIPFICTQSVRSAEFLARISEMEIDLMVSAHFQRLLPASIFTRAKLGALNLHPSLLPRYRGMSPQHWPIIFGDAETGVTVHRIEEGVDTGRILRQAQIPLEPGMYIHQLQRKFLDVYRTLMVEAVELAIAGEPGVLQSSEGTSYFHKIGEEDMEITHDAGVELAGNMVRAFSFLYAGARYGIVRIMKAVQVHDTIWIGLRDANAKIGIAVHGDQRYLVLKDGALELTKWRNT